MRTAAALEHSESDSLPGRESIAYAAAPGRPTATSATTAGTRAAGRHFFRGNSKTNEPGLRSTSVSPFFLAASAYHAALRAGLSLPMYSGT